MILVILWAAASHSPLVTPAWSYFGFSGHGDGGAGGVILSPPANVVASFPNPDQRTVDVSWDMPTELSGIVLDGYYVTWLLGSTPSPAHDTSPSVLTTSLSCHDTDLASNPYTYSVTEVFRSWSSAATSQYVAIPAPVLKSLSTDVITPSPVTGLNTSLGIIAYDQYGSVFTAYNGPECLSFSGPGDSPNGGARPT
jgi:hypothetical protein